MAEQGEEPSSSETRWSELCSLPFTDDSQRHVILSTKPALQFELANQTMLAADSGGVDVQTDLPFDARVSVYEDGGLIVKVTSEDQSLDGQLIGYCLSSESQTKSATCYFEKDC